MNSELICTLITAAAAILVAIIERRNRIHTKRMDERAEIRAKESRLAMDLMYANCALSLTTAKKLANMHTNGDVEDAMNAAKKAQDDYISFIRNEAAKNISE